LALPVHPEPAIAALSEELDQTYRAVIARLPDNPAVRFEQVGGRHDLVLSHLDKLDEPASLIALRRAVDARLPASICRRSCWKSQPVPASPPRSPTSVSAPRARAPLVGESETRAR
jgi:hypothetical protein